MAQIDIELLARRMEKVIVQALDEKDMAARKRGVIGGDKSPLAIEFRGCLSAMKQWAQQRRELVRQG